MLNPAITQYLIADRADEARRQAADARLAREAVAATRAARPARNRVVLSRWRAWGWGWSVTPRAFG